MKSFNENVDQYIKFFTEFNMKRFQTRPTVVLIHGWKISGISPGEKSCFLSPSTLCDNKLQLAGSVKLDVYLSATMM